jgi:hypothetical protein
VGHKQDSEAQLYQLDAHIHKSIMKGPEQGEEDLASRFGELWNVVSFWSTRFEKGEWTGTTLPLVWDVTLRTF